MSPLTALVLIGGGLYALKKIDKKVDYNRAAAQNEKAAEDPHVNLANRLWAERKDYVVTDSVVISLFREITDYNAVKAAYKTASGGADLLQDFQPYVSAATFQQLQEIIGVKGGAKTTTSTTSNDLLAFIKKRVAAKDFSPIYLISTSDIRVRKTPVKQAGFDVSEIFSTAENPTNIVQVAKAGVVLGFVDINAVVRNGYKYFYDDENKVWFIPMQSADAVQKWKKTYPLYAAASEIKYWTKPIVGSGYNMMLVPEKNFNRAKNTQLQGLGFSTTTNNLSKIL